MRFQFTRSSRKHKIGRASARAALLTAGEPHILHYEDGSERLLWIGTDERGRELEMIGRPADEDPDLVLIFHIMPTDFRPEGYWDARLS